MRKENQFSEDITPIILKTRRALNHCYIVIAFLRVVLDAKGKLLRTILSNTIYKRSIGDCYSRTVGKSLNAKKKSPHTIPGEAN